MVGIISGWSIFSLLSNDDLYPFRTLFQQGSNDHRGEIIDQLCNRDSDNVSIFSGSSLFSIKTASNSRLRNLCGLVIEFG
jgi:hypothetical protein